MSFGSFRLTDASSIYFNGFDIAQAQSMDPLLHHTQISSSFVFRSNKPFDPKF